MAVGVDTEKIAELCYQITIKKIMRDLQLTESEAKSYFNMNPTYLDFCKKNFMSMMNDL